MNKEVDINRLNYESFVIDYHDGRLDAIETACFIAFLENNPDIKEEVATFDDSLVISDDEVFTHKSSLKREPVNCVGNINEDNYEEHFIAHYEGDLGENKDKILLDFIDKNPKLKDEFYIHGKLQVLPSDVVFSKKESLKRKSNIGIAWYSSVAAAVLLFMTSWFFFNFQDTSNNIELVSINLLAMRNIPSSIISSNNVEVKFTKRQITAIKNEYENPLGNLVYNKREAVNISPVTSKIFSEQLAGTFNFTRIYSQPKTIIEITPDAFDTELAMAEPEVKKNRKGVIGRIINNQLSKIAQGFKSNISSRKKSTDPTYIKVIDGGLLVFNTITGSETATVKTYNREGVLTSYQIEGRDIPVGRGDASKSVQ